MKTFIFVLLFVSFVFAQKDTVTLKHQFYISTFDTVKHYPIVVQWWVTKKMLSCDPRIDRDDKFVKDPILPRQTDIGDAYKNSGYDRGHNMPAYDNGCNVKGMSECFYYSNMTPQTPTLNRGDWKVLEEYTRDSTMKYDSIKVWCGSVGSIKKIGTVSVPQYCWKILYIKKLRVYQAFIFTNNSKSATLQEHRTTTDALYKLTGLKIKK
jgi:endonuclease G, mitochondrial